MKKKTKARCGYEWISTDADNFGAALQCARDKGHAGECEGAPNGNSLTKILAKQFNEPQPAQERCDKERFCDPLESLINGENGHAMGINAYLVVNCITGARRVLVGARSKTNKRGHFFEVCPFCRVEVNQLRNRAAKTVMTEDAEETL
jgi:hypothetical protein